MGGLRPFLWPLLAVLSRSWDLCWRFWAALGIYVGGFGPLLGPMLAVLGGLRPLLGVMLAVLGRSWDLGPLWAVLAALGAYVGGLGPKSGPNLSGKAIWAGNGPPQGSQPAEGPYGFFLQI